jgi:pyruvate/2-oxoglutarate/acetoin dehydrogenase E1 component
VSTAVSYRQAIRDALAEEMEREESVFLMGEDVAPGGVFNVTPDLHARFPDRVIDTPISELAFTGAAFGAAVRGMRPVVEIMFGDFLGLVIDTLVNQASKYWYLSGGQASVPLVVRSAVGAGGRLGACHSQTPTGWFLGEPGLKLVAPSDAADAKSLLKAAIRDDNPVIFFEHKMLYGLKAELREGADVVPLGKALTRRAGGDVTLVAAMAMVGVSLQAAEQLAEQGIEAEVIDLRTLRPLDADAITASARKTGRLIAVEEGPPTGGYASDVLALAAEAVEGLRVRRVAAPDQPVPFSGPLEDRWRPSVDRVVEASVALAG